MLMTMELLALEVAGPSKPWNLQRRSQHMKGLGSCTTHLMGGGGFSPTHPEKYAQVKLDPISQCLG